MNKFRIFRLVSIMMIFAAYKWSQPNIPPKTPPHQHVVLENFLSNEQHKEMMRMFEELKEFPAASQDFTSTKWVNIGEDYEPTSDGQCNVKYTILYNETGRCQFPNRVDIGRHFIKTGGYNGIKESYTKMIHRLHPFINYQFDTRDRKEFVDLFEAEPFQDAIGSICGPLNPYFRPFQLSMILNLPGQSVPQHLDIPYFFPATRYQFPQWLLLVMQDSGLFKQQRVPQVQALVYVHDWEDDDIDKVGGEFVVYSQGVDYSATAITCKPKSAIFCDGSELVHATSIYKPDIPPYKFDKDVTSAVKFDDDNNVWRLYVDEKATDNTYNWQNIRASIAYRGWCFSDEDLMNSWDPRQWDGDLSLDDIMNVFRRDLVNNKKAISVEKWNNLNEYDKGLFLMDQYIKLPKPTLSRIPWNYCILFTELPEWGIFKMIENFIC